jgi:hypothetical protein
MQKHIKVLVKMAKKDLRFAFIFTVIVSMLLTQMSIRSNSEIDDVRVISCRGLNTEGYYIIFGEVQNNKTYAITDVKIEVSLINASGAKIGVINASTSLLIIPPKRRSPFVAYYMGSAEQRNAIQNITIDRIFSNIATGKPEALVLVYYTFNNGTFYTHILNNSTMVGEKKATNHLKIVATLYKKEKIVATGAGFLNLDAPGLLWDTDTTAVANGEPITIYFGAPFLEDEVNEVDKLIASVESPEFSAQHEIFGYRYNDEWTWYTSDAEDNPHNTNLWFESIVTLVTLIFLGAIIAFARYLNKKKKKHLHIKKGARVKNQDEKS